MKFGLKFLARWTPASVTRLLRDERGSYIILMALALPFMAGMAGLGSEGAIWLFKKRALQGAADNASYSAATAYAVNTTSDLLLQAKAIAADSGLVSGTNGVTVTVNHPPASGCGTASTYNGDNKAIEVVVSQTVTRYFSRFYSGAGNATICSRSITYVSGGGDCIMSLGNDNNPGITATDNNLNLNLTGCSLFSNSKNTTSAISLASGGNASLHVETIGAVGGVNLSGHIANTDITPTSGNPKIDDPYATTASTVWPQAPSGAPQLGNPGNGGSFQCCNLSPGNYSKGLTLSAGGDYVMAAGVYYITGDLTYGANNISLTGNGVTIIVTGNIDMNKNKAVITITAPAAGATQGLAIWANGVNKTLNLGRNNSSANITGLVYAPNSTLNFNGNSGSSGTPLCLQLVAKAISITGNSMYMTGNCSGVAGLKKFGQTTALVQ